MCGIACGIGIERDRIESALDAISHRGPDARGIFEDGDVLLGHVRLSVMDVDPRSDQPMGRRDMVVSYNGELWNFRGVRRELESKGIEFSTSGDTEIVVEALAEWGTDAIRKFNGMFVVAWWDGRELFVARDRFGEIPFHVGKTRSGQVVGCSELKGLAAMGADPANAVWLEPGCVLSLSTGRSVSCVSVVAEPRKHEFENAAAELRARLEESCAERAMSDVPACCLLSGGLDSSVVLALMRETVPSLVAYTAKMNEKSPDLKAAREVAGFLGIELMEVNVPSPSAADLSSVVSRIEMPYKTQVEIGWACMCLADRMKSDGMKVVFSGEGSDELWGSYGFAYYALKKTGWHEYRQKLFADQARKNFARCNKIFMSRSVECRLPFLNPGLVELALSLSKNVVTDGETNQKAILQRAASGLLPRNIVSRKKLAFQDGLGMKSAAANAVSNPKRFYAIEYANYLSKWRNEHG